MDRFEDMLAEITGARHAVATVNGTAALHAALLSVGVEPGDEVLLPSFTFVATANAVAYCGATPHFVDCETDSLRIDPVALAAHLDAIGEVHGETLINRETGAIIRALVPVHCYGHPANMSALADIATRFGLTVVEDAAESLGSTIGGTHTGRFGRAGAFSFNGNKTITTGGGYASRPFWAPLHRMPMYAHAPRAALETTERLSACGLTLPSGAGLAGEIDR
ncbi:MAG: aminotransferase class I/II-fold pyridoxal phosphate-dependent enzyme [Rhodospirillaceae bacterium]